MKIEYLYFLLVVLLGNNCLSNKAEELTSEEIVGGKLAVERQFKNVVAVMYKPREGNLPNQYPCAGSIVHDLFITTVAHCFYDKRIGGLRHKEYLIVISVTDLKYPSLSTQYLQIDLLIIPSSYDPLELDDHLTVGDLAVVKLKNRLGLRTGHSYLGRKIIARDINVPTNLAYTVAGFGWNEVELVTDDEHFTIDPKQVGQSDGKLRYANVTVLDQATCERDIEDIIAKGNMCVKIVQGPHEHQGICKGDSGSPLMRGNFLVGLAINGYPECNENRKPGIYLNTQAYNTFITSIIRNDSIKNMRIYQLRQRNNTFEFTRV